MHFSRDPKRSQWNHLLFIHSTFIMSVGNCSTWANQCQTAPLPSFPSHPYQAMPVFCPKMHKQRVGRSRIRTAYPPASRMTHSTSWTAVTKSRGWWDRVVLGGVGFLSNFFFSPRSFLNHDAGWWTELFPRMRKYTLQCHWSCANAVNLDLEPGGTT